MAGLIDPSEIYKGKVRRVFYYVFDRIFGNGEIAFFKAVAVSRAEVGEIKISGTGKIAKLLPVVKKCAVLFVVAELFANAFTGRN